MDRVLKILLVILSTLIIIITIAIVWACVYLNNKCIPMYDYVKQDGTTGLATVCFDTERGKTCREGKRNFAVVEYKQGDVCKDD